MARKGKRGPIIRDPIVDKKYGKLTVIRVLPLLKSGSYNSRHRVLCECSCGNRVITPKYYLKRQGNPKRDCGGCGKPIKREIPLTHHPEYSVWRMMNHRCTNPGHVSYEAYGGAGVRVCERWATSFEAFMEDMGSRPSSDHSLDRKDPHGNYEPDNVKWATTQEQAWNKKNTHYVTHPDTGEVLPAGQIASEMGMSYHAFRNMMIGKGKWGNE